MREAGLKKWQDPEYRRRRREAHQDPERLRRKREKCRVAALKRWQNPEFRRRRRELWQNLEWRQWFIATMREDGGNPRTRAA
jgi:hypothetical protein